MRIPGQRASAVALCGALLFAASASADPVEDFYKGRTITVITSTGVGGPFDLTARAVAKHMPKNLAGRPGIIVKNKPGGGHVVAAKFMSSQAARDGTFIGTVINIIPLHQRLGGRW